MNLPSFNNLTHVNRCEPCQEYPGEWVVYEHGAKVGTFRDDLHDSSHFSTAEERAIKFARELSDLNCSRVTVHWQCSANDPRIGEVWFTMNYQTYSFNNCFF